MRLIILFFCCSLLNTTLTAQATTDFSDQEEKLTILSQQFLKDSLAKNRMTAAETFAKTLKTTLAQKNSFAYTFPALETISILYPADSTFRIFTWQIYVDKNDYQYGGIIQMNKAENVLFELQDQSSDIATYDLEYEVLGAADWYGALYFNLHEFETAKGKQYLLFGFDGFQFFNKRKIAEALYFDENGQPVFGAPAFAKTASGYEATTQNRLYLEYSSEVAARLNYDPNLEMIILDNLVSMKSPYRGVGNVNIPDGSYEGYQLKNGVWEHVDKVFSLVSEKPPAPRRVLNDGNQKDIFGKQTKGKKRDKNLPYKN